MSQLLKQSTAATFRIGPFVDNTDGYTPETALTLTQSDYRLSKNGGAFAQKNDATSGTHDENGWYTCVLNTTDTNTLGTLDLAIYEVGALPVFEAFMVVPANVYDSLVAGTDLLDISMTQVNGSAVNNLVSGRIDASIGAVATGAIAAASFAANALDAVWSTTTRVLTAGTNIQLASNALANITAWTVALTGNITGNLSGSVGSVTGNVGGNVTGSVGSVTGAVGSVTGNVGGNVTGSVASVVGNVGGSVANVLALAADSVNASALATSAVTEIQTGLATSSAQTTIGNNVTSIKAKTDSLTFTKANELDSNIQSVNDVTVTGNGSPATPWGP